MNIPKNTLLAVELITGEKLIGKLVEPNQASPSFLKGLGDGIFLMRTRHVSYLASDTIKNIRPALPGEKEIDNK